ncbi:iron-siderophore ABC transporter substrate-binding protein [Streptacidiphilus sp. N1-12]|uniref:Iron-siderophore ABC transporter substrate-binding protein n=2 Tax=Streptacidiphilus alkalitolerans TaxID=3342712 RepID=A0ABV6WN60_9ACTN
MSRSPRGVRPAAALASVLLLLGVATGCGSSSSTATGAGAGSPSGSASGAAPSAFPVTLVNKFGSTTVSAAPKRIVTVGLTDQDAVLALGQVPVGTTEWLGGYKGAIGPWATDKLGGATPPTVLTDPGTGPQVEKIAALHPDLILALYAGLTKDQYQNLSKIAPVVAAPEGYNDYGIPWQQQTELIGQALGKADQAKQLVAGVTADFTAAAKAHPEFARATAVMATPYQGIFVYGSQDARSRVLTSLGFKLPANLDKVIGDQFGNNISEERTDLLDADAIVWIVGNPAKDEATLHANKLYGDLNVVKQGREVFVKDSSDFGNAVSFVSVLSLPYTLDRLVPQLAEAVDGNPATPVVAPTD